MALEELLTLGRGALPAVRLALPRGSADSRVQPNAQRTPFYEIRTPHVNLGVRGTEFRVQTTDAASRMQVLSGAVHADGWRANVRAGQGLLADGQGRSVTPLLPAPDLSGLPATIERLPLQVRWPAGPPGAVAWRVQLLAGRDVDRLLLDTRTGQPAAAWREARELPDGDYTLRVRAIDGQGQEGLAADAGLSLQARPEPPFIQAPAEGAVSYAGSVSFAWTRNETAPRVRLQVARDEAFEDLVLQPPPIDAARFDLRLPDGAYHWRIASVDAGGRAGPFSDPQRVELRPPPPSPPPAASEVEGDRLVLRWRADEGVVRYEAEWAGTAAFDGPGVQRHTTQSPQLALPKPPPGTYFLRVRAFNEAGAAGPWGQTQVIEQPHPRWPWLLLLLLVPLL